MRETTFTNISEWQKNLHYSTGGTRSKYVAIDPESNDAYFFKGSKETIDGIIRYETEFWSEIISSKIGLSLGFPLLDYNIGFDKNHKQQIGCLSKTMITESSSKLTEGIAYLTGTRSSYKPETDKKDYTFQFISEALNKFSLKKYISNIIQMIIFDSIIGNSDRHQENWGVITTRHLLKFESPKLKPEENKWKDFTNRIFKLKAEIIPERKLTYRFGTKSEFAPIYDSGCCLGREHNDEKVEKLLNDKQMLEAYINRGESEIHWDGYQKKCKHFELVGLLVDNEEETKNYIEQVKSNYNPELIKEIIYNIDKNIPIELIKFKLSNNRKELMFKLVTLRTEKLIKLI